jgi:uncharacterized RmlC-like cupin family protein
MLTNRAFSALVEAGTYPEQISVPLDEPFVNKNGRIQNLLLERFTSAAIITSVPGAVRANHYHKTDWHYSYVISGSIRYFWRSVGSEGSPLEELFGTGAMFFTPPLVEHAMFFPEQTAFITFAKNIRDHEHHEADVVRVELVQAHADPSAEGGFRITFPSSS